jgi:hypothetical protein
MIIKGLQITTCNSVLLKIAVWLLIGFGSFDETGILLLATAELMLHPLLPLVEI